MRRALCCNLTILLKQLPPALHGVLEQKSCLLLTGAGHAYPKPVICLREAKPAPSIPLKNSIVVHRLIHDESARVYGRTSTLNKFSILINYLRAYQCVPDVRKHAC